MLRIFGGACVARKGTLGMELGAGSAGTDTSMMNSPSGSSSLIRGETWVAGTEDVVEPRLYACRWEGEWETGSAGSMVYSAALSQGAFWRRGVEEELDALVVAAGASDEYDRAPDEYEMPRWLDDEPRAVAAADDDDEGGDALGWCEGAARETLEENERWEA